MRLFIAEKPSLARSIAAVLSKPQENNKLFIKAGDDIVAWASGHLLEQAMPEYYDEKYKRWDISHIPLEIKVWKMLPKKGCDGLLINYTGKVLHILISDTNPEAVRKALDNLRPNSDFSSTAA